MLFKSTAESVVSLSISQFILNHTSALLNKLTGLTQNLIKKNGKKKLAPTDELIKFI